MRYLVTNVFPTSGQSFRFDWISIVFFVIVVLCVIRGIRQGFISSLLQFVGLAVVFFLAYLLAKPIGEWLQSINGMGENVHEKLISFFIEKGAQNPVTTGNDVYDALIKEQYGSNNVMEWVVSGKDLNSTVPGSESTILELAINAAGVPSFLADYVKNFVINAVPETGATQNLAYYLSTPLSSLLFVAIGFICVFFIGYILLIIVKIFAKKLNHVKIIGPINRILGGVFGLLVAFVDLSLISGGLVALSANANVYAYLDALLGLSDDKVYSIGKVFYNNNFLEILMGYYNSVVSWIKAQ